MRGRERDQPLRHGDAVERRPDRRRAAQARRRERDELVAPGRGGGHALRASRGCSCRSPCADARAARRRPRSSLRLQVDEGVEVGPELAVVGVARDHLGRHAVGVTVNRTRQRLPTGSSGTRSVAVPSGGTTIRATGSPRTLASDAREPPGEERGVARVRGRRAGGRPCSGGASRSPCGPTRCRSDRGRSPASATRAARSAATAWCRGRRARRPPRPASRSRRAGRRAGRRFPRPSCARCRRRRRGPASRRCRPASARTCSRRRPTRRLKNSFWLTVNRSARPVQRTATSSRARDAAVDPVARDAADALEERTLARAEHAVRA